MPEESLYIPKLQRIQMMLGQYPILGDVMRERMRQELFRRGVITKERFEEEVREKAVQSQRREGIFNPYQLVMSGDDSRAIAYLATSGGGPD